MNFVFEIPRNNKELLEEADCSNYFVKQVYEVGEIPTYLRAAHKALQENGAFYIFDHFDAFFSVTENAAKLQIQTLNRAIDILYTTAENLGQMLEPYLNQESLDRQNDFLNLIKMVMYLVVSTVKSVDAFQKNHTTPSKISSRKTKRKNDDDSLSLFTSYERRRYDVLILICNIIQMPIEKLWHMSIMEDDFINLFCDLAYRSLLHPSNKEKRVNEAIFQILGTAIKQYRHGIAFPVQIAEIFEREESAIISIAHGVHFLNDKFGIKTALSNLLNEIIERVNVNPVSQMASKHLSIFISEIAVISPELSLQCLDMSPDLLNLEPYAVRNSVLCVMSNIIVNHLTGEDLNEDQKILRNEYFEDLWNHMNDVNSYVRSKVLHIWNDLKNRNAVPIDWILRIVNRANERLEDKTATVRKNAITLLKSFLESNPFASTLQLEMIEQKLTKEKENLNALKEMHRKQLRTMNDVLNDFNTRWSQQLNTVLTKILSDYTQIESLVKSVSNDTVKFDERVQRIRQYLANGEFDNVSRYIIQLEVLVGNYNEWKSLQLNEKLFYFNTLLKSYLFDDYESEIEKIESIVRFLNDAKEFSLAIASTVPKLENLLMSTTCSDILECIEFFKTGYLFNINGMENGMRLMLRLLYINSGTEKNEKGEAVVKAYHQILFGTDTTGRIQHVKVVDNLCAFLQNISTSEYTAFQLMIKKWVDSGEININIVNSIFERFTFKTPNTTSASARCAMELLILVSKAKPAVAHNNTTLIIDIIKSNRILDDPRFFTGCLQLLMNSVQPAIEKVDKTIKTSGYYKRLDDTQLIDGIIDSFKKFFFYPKLLDFESIAIETINFLYKMCYGPDVLCETIILSLCNKLMEISKKYRERKTQTDRSESFSSQMSEMFISKYMLPRIIFIFGYVATKELVYLHEDVTINIKYREDLTNSQNNNRNCTANYEGSINESFKRLGPINGLTLDPNDPNSTYMGATAEDNLGDLINNICEHQLIGHNPTDSNGLLNNFVPILIEILSHPAKYPDEYVQRAAVLALMRFMAVSGAFCSDKIAFLMNILRKTKYTSMKCNIIIGLADLTGRFANIVEPWIPNFFVLLLETDESVRLTTFKMLSHVILQAIIRVTGHISEMAVCIVDANLEIRNEAREFFRQLVISKESEYYKVMPDIISRLSSNDSPIPEDKFRTVMQYLFEFLHKERQAENLVDKLCSRFRNTNSERQWRDIAFCLSLINSTEKTMKKLIDHLPHYKDKLQYDEIYDCLMVIISNANKQSMKPAMKELTKEFDAKLQKCLEAGLNNISIDVSMIDMTDMADNEPSKSQSKRINKRKSTQLKKKVQKSIVSSDEDDDFEENIPPRQRQRRKRKI